MRFMSTRSSEVNLRRGPGQQYPIDWKLLKSYYPLLVVAEYGIWRKVKDVEGSEGWIHQNMLVTKRSGIVMKETFLYKKPDFKSPVVAQLKPKVLVLVKDVQPAWCRVMVGDYSGWIERSHMWGTLEQE